MQRLYKRRRTDANGMVRSNWDIFQENSVISGNKEIDKEDTYDDTIREVIFEGGII